MEFTLTGLRVVREVAERGTFSAAAESLGYTQSAVSRQIAAVEKTAGAAVFERRRDGAVPTTAGRVILRHAAAVLDEMDAVERELRGLPMETGHVRLGVIPSAGAVVLPRTLTILRRTHPGITVTSREGSTPALTRSIRAGTIDVAVLAAVPPFRAPDTDKPALHVETLTERDLCVAVPTTDPLAENDSVHVDELAGRRWIASRSSGEEPLLGVWPGLPERPEIVHVARDWLTKLQLVAAGCGLTTVPASMTAAMPANVRVLSVRGGPQERRRLIVAHLPGRQSEPVARVLAALRAATRQD
ncbi:LysR family transcriptional regulator [Kutzneria kofuensis]|uniref:DNA-binding transcriptional LysR family regulator n=1 Tax=Kutzneria kofuensis TaxID=103725 RepID=A0A7W9KA54_9PSEU|nr:LysR family transcriptional regulator [Kutzneria kofuensis]MBB5888868.1 DNA-binding transcriptional LysR family regulator [Kutzneria kofuensis]